MRKNYRTLRENVILFPKAINAAVLKMFFACTIIYFPSCVNPEDNYNKQDDQNNSIVKNIYDVSVTLQPGEGMDLVERNCIICHSLRYIEMQPLLSKKSWEKTVHKMVKNFGAPIHDSLTEKNIVKYITEMQKEKFNQK